MALDYKTSQAIGPELLPTRETYCLECGQSFARTVVVNHQPSVHSWWWALMVAVGISLMMTSGLRALHDAQLMRAVSSNPSDQLLPNARAQLEHELLAGSTGVVLALVACGTWARQRLVRDHPAPLGVVGTLLGIWRSGETLVIALFALIALGFGYLLASELYDGRTLSLALIDRTLTRVVDVIVLIAELIAAGYPKV